MTLWMKRHCVEETEEEDLSGGEGYADRLQALLLGIWSPDKDDDVACDFVEGWFCRGVDGGSRR